MPILTDTLVAPEVTELVAGAVFVDDALSLHTAERQVVRVAVMAWFTLTQGLPVGHLAAGVVATDGRGARVDALEDSLCVLLAGLLSLAGAVILALVGFEAAGCRVRVAHSEGRTGTLVGSWHVDARGRLVARVLPTLVHVDTAAGSWQVALGAHTLLRDADFVQATVAITAAARDTRPFYTHLPLQAVAVPEADLVTQASGTALALGTLAVLPTHGLALAMVTGGAGAAFFGGNTGRRDANAALLWRGCRAEAVGTLALRQVALDAALGVGSAHIVLGTRVITLVVDAALLDGAVAVAAAA